MTVFAQNFCFDSQNVECLMNFRHRFDQNRPFFDREISSSKITFFKKHPVLLFDVQFPMPMFCGLIGLARNSSIIPRIYFRRNPNKLALNCSTKLIKIWQQFTVWILPRFSVVVLVSYLGFGNQHNQFFSAYTTSCYRKQPVKKRGKIQTIQFHP